MNHRNGTASSSGGVQVTMEVVTSVFISVPNLGLFEADTLQVTTASACSLPWQGGRDQQCLSLLVTWLFPLRS